MPEAFDKPLIAARRPAAVKAGTRLGRIIARLPTARVEFRYWHGREKQHELAGSGRLQVESREGGLHCRVLGDLFKRNPFEFVFHQFWLTRRGMIMVVLDLAEDLPPASRGQSGSFLYFLHPPDPELWRAAIAFRAAPFRDRKRKPS